MGNLMPILIATVAIATLLNVILKRFNMPTIIGYIFTGAIISAVFDVEVHGNETLEHIAEFGIVFLMFSIGLEFSVSHLKEMKKEVFLFGTLQVVLTAIVMTLLAQLFFNLDFRASIIVGSGLALSSTAIVLKILNETGKIKEIFGKNSLGILIFQDIAVIPILLMITIFTSQDKSLSELLISTAINAAIALGILVVIGKFFLSYFFKVVSNVNSKEIYMGSILLTVIGASYIAHHFGFSYSLGGFIAGMMIADTIYKYQVEADLIPFKDLLLGVFFVSVGLQIDINVVLANAISVVLLSIGIMFVKGLSIFAIFSFSNNNKSALKTALTLSQIGEFSLVVFSLVLANQMMDPTSVQVLMVVIILSMVMTPFIINNTDKIVGLFFKSNISEDELDQSSVIGGHVILCGYGAFGRVVSEQLNKENIDHIVVTNNTEAFVKANEAGETVVFGDPSDRVLLERLNISDAMSTVLALDDFEEVKQVSAAISLINPNIKVIAKIPTEEDKKELAEFDHELILDGNSHVASLLVSQISRSRLLAKETSKLQYLSNYSLDDPSESIAKIEKEQARLLDVMSQSFNALREEKDIMHIKAFHESFKVLSGIVGKTINEIMTHASLSSKEYEHVNILLDNQQQLISINESLEELGKELKSLSKIESTESLSHTAVEGLDAVLLSLIAIATEYDEIDMMMLESMTSEKGKGLSKIREAYLSEEMHLDPSEKALLMSSTNHMDRLKSLFGLVGKNYKKLTELSCQ